MSGVRSVKYARLGGGMNDVDGRNEQAVTSRCRRDGAASGSVHTVTVA
jgi:hypothetical protein